jgi:hypothetical protein
MTRAIPFTKARLRRAIGAAREAGLRVTGIRPDGTLLVGENTPSDVAGQSSDVEAIAPSKWGMLRHEADAARFPVPHGRL